MIVSEKLWEYPYTLSPEYMGIFSLNRLTDLR